MLENNFADELKREKLSFPFPSAKEENEIFQRVNKVGEAGKTNEQLHTMT
jgi:hypothetical protein